MHKSLEGIVIREQNMGEADRLLTLLTKEEGLVYAFAKGVRGAKSHLSYALQLFCYSRVTLFASRDKTFIDEAELITSFFSIGSNLSQLSLAQYFSELFLEIAPEGEEAGNFLRLLLNALHFLKNGGRPVNIVKSVVELRGLSMAGYMPDLICCQECKQYAAEEMFFSHKTGQLFCGNCLKDRTGMILLPAGVLAAMRHIVYSEFDKLFSFALSPEGAKVLEYACENYVLGRLERSFATLEFYKMVT